MLTTVCGGPSRAFFTSKSGSSEKRGHRVILVDFTNLANTWLQCSRTIRVERLCALSDLAVMAPNLTKAQRQHVVNLLHTQQLNDLEIAEQIPCTDRAVRRIRSNLKCFGRPIAPCYDRGRPRLLTLAMMQHVCQDLVRTVTMKRPYRTRDQEKQVCRGNHEVT